MPANGRRDLIRRLKVNGYLNTPTDIPVNLHTRGGTIDVQLYKHKPVIAMALNLAMWKERKKEAQSTT